MDFLSSSLDSQGSVKPHAASLPFQENGRVKASPAKESATSTTNRASGQSLAANTAGAGWYFAFGANMAASVFIERRKIRPLRTEVAQIPTHALCFNVLGIPYADPGNGSLRELQPGSTDAKAAVHGVAYLLTEEDLKRVVLSEGSV